MPVLFLLFQFLLLNSAWAEPCGASGQVCCPSPATGQRTNCAAPAVCNTSSGRCETCGADGQLCCPGAICNGSAQQPLTCNPTENRCRKCGVLSQSCCPAGHPLGACLSANYCDPAMKKCNQTPAHTCKTVATREDVTGQYRLCTAITNANDCNRRLIQPRHDCMCGPNNYPLPNACRRRSVQQLESNRNCVWESNRCKPYSRSVSCTSSTLDPCW